MLVVRERARLKERLRRLRYLYLDGYPEPEYRREKEAMIQAWQFAIRGDKRDMLLMMLEAVHVDVPIERLVAFQVKPPFKPLFRVSLERKEPQLLTVRFGHSDTVLGDPEGIRTPDLHRDRVAC
jgi:hypothetical protein